MIDETRRIPARHPGIRHLSGANRTSTTHAVALGGGCDQPRAGRDLQGGIGNEWLLATLLLSFTALMGAVVALY